MPENELTISRVKVAENLVEGIQYLSRREVLAEISANNPLFSYDCKEAKYNNSTIEWMKVEQVGLCHNYTKHQYFSAIQKALFSCHKPDCSQIIFMVHGDGEKINIYIGVRHIEEKTYAGVSNTFTERLSSNLNTLVPGSKINFIQDLDKVGNSLIKDIENKKYRHLYALSGIPSFMPKEGEEDLSTIDNLVGPLSRNKFVYFVVADPLDEYRVKKIMTQCLEYAGKIESIKSFNISETSNISTTLGTNDSISESLHESSGSSVNRKGKKHHFWCKVLATIGLGNFVDQSTNTITKGLAHGESHAVSQSDTQGFSRTSSMTVINKCAEYAAEQMIKQAKRYDTGSGLGMWETGVYLLTEKDDIAQSASLQLRSIVSGKESSLEPIRIHDLSKLLNTVKVSSYMIDSMQSFSIPNVTLKTEDGDTIASNYEYGDERLTTKLTTEELTCYINLPQRSIPGISVVDYSLDFHLTPQKFEDGVQKIDLGKLVYSGSKSSIPLYLPIDTLSRHSLVCGVNGSGKTNTVLSVLEGILKADRSFLVIEPAKTEYVDWAIEYNKTVCDDSKKIKIFMPGCGRYAKKDFKPEILRMNPFEVISKDGSEMRVSSHIDRLKSTFAAAFPMQDILPVVMEHLLHYIYTESHPLINPLDPSYGKRGFPRLSTIDNDFIKDLMLNLGYAQENTQNISAALRTRFESLKFGWKGEMLNNERLTGITWNELFDSPCVINLSYAGDDQDRAFMMSLILQFLYEYRIAESEAAGYSFNDNICRHLVVVEEAHRVMCRCPNPEMPQHKSGMMFSNFLSEVRAYGQGMMIVDQVPTRLIEDAIKNTNVKIIHKLVAADDSKQIAECIGLTERQQTVISKLSIGQAVLAGLNSTALDPDESSAVYLAQIHKKK